MSYAWLYRIELTPFPDNPSHADGRALAKELAQKLRSTINQRHTDIDLEDIIIDLDDIARDGIVEEFNSILEDLYDWGDVGKRLWVGTR